MSEKCLDILEIIETNEGFKIRSNDKITNSIILGDVYFCVQKINNKYSIIVKNNTNENINIVVFDLEFYIQDTFVLKSNCHYIPPYCQYDYIIPFIKFIH